MPISEIASVAVEQSYMFGVPFVKSGDLERIVERSLNS